MRKVEFNSKPALHIAIALGVLLMSAGLTHAESVTYSFFGSEWLTGTDFTYVSPTGFLSFDTGPLVPTTATDVYFYDISGAYFKNDIGALASFDFVTEDELVLKTTTGCILEFTNPGGFSHANSVCPSESFVGGSSVLAFGYLLDVFTNFDVVGAGEIGIRPTATGSVPEPSGLIAGGLATVLTILICLRRRRPKERGPVGV